MLQNTDISLKYWIHPSQVCELRLLVKEQEREEEKRERQRERWDPWINCYQFISFTGQSEACNAGWNWILVVVKHHKSKQCEYLKVRNHFGQHGTWGMYKGAWKNGCYNIIYKYGTTVVCKTLLNGCWKGGNLSLSHWRAKSEKKLILTFKKGLIYSVNSSLNSFSSI